MKHKNFFMVPNSIFELELKPRELAVYCCLLKYCDEDMTCYPSRSTIGKDCCIDESTVDNALGGLIQKGFILVCVQLFCNIIASRKFGFEKIRFYGWDKKLFIDLFSFTSSIFVASIVNQFNSNVDTIVLGVFSTTVIVGLYASIMQIHTIYSSLSTAIQGVFFAQVSRTVFENKDDDEITESIIFPSRLQIIVLFLALSGFVVFGDSFLEVWIGDSYTDQQLNSAYIAGIIVMASSMWQLFQN